MSHEPLRPYDLTTLRPYDLTTSLENRFAIAIWLKRALIGLLLLCGASSSNAQSIGWSNTSTCDYIMLVMYGDATRCEESSDTWSCVDPCTDQFTLFASGNNIENPIICTGSAHICMVYVYDSTGANLLASLQCNESDFRDVPIPCGAGSVLLEMGKWMVKIYP